MEKYTAQGALGKRRYSNKLAHSIFFAGEVVLSNSISRLYYPVYNKSRSIFFSQILCPSIIQRRRRVKSSGLPPPRPDHQLVQNMQVLFSPTLPQKPSSMYYQFIGCLCCDNLCVYYGLHTMSTQLINRTTIRA